MGTSPKNCKGIGYHQVTENKSTLAFARADSQCWHYCAGRAKQK